MVALVRPYRPELHYMRGPGPKWHQKHGLGAPCDRERKMPFASSFITGAAALALLIVAVLAVGA
jgi:hypothetical protein